MSGKIVHQMWCGFPDCDAIPFHFFPNGSSAVGQTTIKGLDHVASITRTDVGVFDLVLRAPYIGIAAFVPFVHLATDADVTVSSVKWVNSTKTLTIRVRSGGSAADIAADANNILGGVLFMRRSSVGK